jgi:hypothetical protein
MWRWSELITDDFFIDLPPDFSWDLVPEELKAEESKAAEPEKKQSIFYYSRITTQHCIDKDLAFCEALAIAYSRILEDKSEKLFLRGNMFLAKITKAIFEQNGNLFAEACGKYKDEKYFRECAEELDKLDFVIDKDKKVDKNSWLDLYEIVLLLTGEYLATKCELPKISVFECKENDDATEKMEIIAVSQSASEGDIAEAALAPMARNGLEDSSDKVKAGELFYEFLGENFPFKDSKEELAEFMKEVYGEGVCGDLDWFYNDVANGSIPRPEIKIDAMEDEDALGDHEGDTIFINQRLVLDAISSKNPKDGFILLLTMLLEYGHFLGYVLQSKTGKVVSNPKIAGRTFAYWFMEYSSAGLFKSDFEFADFVTSDSKGKEQRFMVNVSSLSYEQRQGIFYSLGTENIWEGEA